MGPPHSPAKRTAWGKEMPCSTVEGKPKQYAYGFPELCGGCIDADPLEIRLHFNKVRGEASPHRVAHFVRVTRWRFGSVCRRHTGDPLEIRLHFNKVRGEASPHRVAHFVRVTRWRFGSVCRRHTGDPLEIRLHFLRCKKLRLRRRGRRRPTRHRRVGTEFESPRSFPKKRKDTKVSFLFFGDPLEIRTPDPLLKRQLLYLLS